MNSRPNYPRYLPRPIKYLSRWRNLLLLFVLLGGVYFLYQNSKWVSTQQVSRYTDLIQHSIELNSRIDSEMLASRMNLSHNYDALSTHTHSLLRVTRQLLKPPVPVNTPDYEHMLQSVAGIERVLAEKQRYINLFKRSNAVFYSSQAFFKKSAGEFFANYDVDKSKAYATEELLRKYIINVMLLLSDPGHATLENSHTLEQQLTLQLAAERNQQYAVLANSILRHGNVLAEHITVLNRVLRDAKSLEVSGRYEALNQQFFAVIQRHEKSANIYKNFLYASTAILSFYLIFLFVRLERIRGNLSRSNQELARRYELQLQAEKMLRIYEIAFNSAHEGISLTDADGNIMAVNPSFCRITGYSSAEIVGRNPRILKSGHHDKAFYKAMWQSIETSGNWRGEIWNCNKFGDVYPELLSVTSVANDAGEISNYVAVFSDISHIKKHEQELERMAYYDTLTGLPNRVLLRDRMDMAMAHCRRSQEFMAVCYLDLDGFKAVNDSHGHEMGDRLLAELAYRFQQVLRDEDTVARMGGDEFIFLLTSLKEPLEYEKAVERILKEVKRPVVLDDLSLNVTGSIGVSLYPSLNVDADTLIRFADQTMYQIKKTGRNDFAVFDDEQDDFERSQHKQQARMAQALQRDEFELYYQPQANMRKGSIDGLEALIRWNDPERGLMPPAEFLPLIEGSDLMIEVGDWVIEQALRQISTWWDQGHQIMVSVNVAAVQLQQPDFLDKLRSLLERYPKVRPQSLQMEILETVALEDIISVSRLIDQCRGLGVGVALDDFGTGYSSLTYLKRLPASCLKIDRSFIQDITFDPESLALIRGVLGLAKAFGKTPLAEGVESIEHGSLLMQLGCDLAQGYGIAKPMKATAVIDWIENWAVPPEWKKLQQCHWDDRDYPLIVAQVEHGRWVEMVRYAIARKQSIPDSLLKDHTHCNFGRWYYSTEAQQRYGGLVEFARIEPVHIKIHRVVLSLAESYSHNDDDGVDRSLKELRQCQLDIIENLSKIQWKVGCCQDNKSQAGLMTQGERNEKPFVDHAGCDCNSVVATDISGEC